MTWPIRWPRIPWRAKARASRSLFLLQARQTGACWTKLEHKHPAYRQLLGYEPGTPVAQMDAAKLRDVSPVTFATKDDPPVLILHGDADVIVPVEHAHALEAALKKAGVKVGKVILPNARHNVSGAGDPRAHQPALQFIRKHLQSRKK